MRYLFLVLLLFPSISSADLARVYSEYNPGATYVKDQVNFSSVASVCRTYIGTCLTQEQVDTIETSFILPDAKDIKRQELNNEALRRANIYYPDVPVGVFKLVRDTILAIPSPQPGSDLLAVKDIENARASIIGEINAFNNVSAVIAFDSFTGLP